MVRVFAGACVVRLSEEAIRESVALCWHWARVAFLHRYFSCRGNTLREYKEPPEGSSGQQAPIRSPSGLSPFPVQTHRHVDHNHEYCDLNQIPNRHFAPS